MEINIELDWKPSFSASCMHAAHWLATYADGNAESPLAELRRPAVELARALAVEHLPADAMWQQLEARSIDLENNRDLAYRAITKIAGPQRAELLAPRIGGRIADIESAARRCVPELPSQLQAACESLQKTWETGRALLLETARQTDPRIIVPRAQIAVVCPVDRAPVVTAFLDYNSVTIEPALDEHDAPVPTVVYLAWAIAQLNVDLPLFADGINRYHLPLIAALALWPAVWEAGVRLGVVTGEEQAMLDAIGTWDAAAGVADCAEILLSWWRTYQESRPGWTVALTALDQMLPDIQTETPQLALTPALAGIYQ